MDSVHVAVAVIADRQGRILLARRPEHAHQGGLWEFPGGKVDPGETLAEALVRECREELGIEVRSHRPLISIGHDYGDRRVLLDVHRVEQFDHEPRGLEGQPLAWVAPEALGDYPMPAADRPIVNAICLPDRYAITSPDIDDPSDYLDALERTLAAGVRLVQFRVDAAVRDRTQLAAETVRLCHAAGAEVLINADVALARAVDADGVHLKSHQLPKLSARPEGFRWVAGSCHDAGDIAHLQRVDADFGVLSPVAATQSHPDATPLGWSGFASLVRSARVPLFGLGGLGQDAIPEAWRHGAQGVAAIRGLWGGR